MKKSKAKAKRIHQRLGKLVAELLKTRFKEQIKKSKKLYSRKAKHKHKED
jgi:hypothetical protein